ncbi:MAG: hypothetical protein LBS19_00935, partial [Clostridiales bacterium]|nr:hypothetical protein [Clostridiales bacterium]
MIISEQTATVTFENEPLASLVITKIDGSTGETLSGASFRVALDDGSDFYDVQTDGSGEAKLENLKAGTYTVTELTAPNGYVLNTTVEIVKLEPGKEGTLTFSDWTKPGIVIKKYDEKTGQPLADAEFSVAVKGGNIVFEGMTDGSGLIKVEGLDPGWYTVSEMAAPDGYLIVSPFKDVLLEEGKTVEVKFDNRPRPSLVIKKLDAQTGQPLAGAEFNVIKTEDKTVSEYVTDASGTITINDLDEAVYSIVEVKAPEGYILDPQHYDIALEWGMTKTLIFENTLRPKLEIKKVDSVTGEPLGGARFLVTKTEDLTVSEYVTDETGVLLLENLDPAIYTVEEILAPEGWILDPQKKEIELEGGKTKTLIYEDVRKPTLIITKTNSLTFAPIPNATFSVDYESAAGGIFPLGRFRTDENGQIILPKVAPGWYIVTEVIPAPGFSLPDNPVTRLYLNPGENAYEAYTDGFYTRTGEYGANVKVAAGGDFILGGEIMDYPLNSIVIKKVSSVNGELLAGAAFEVRRVTEEVSGGSGTVIGRYTTDNSGIIVITGLEPGGYIVEEVQAPPNYMLIENSQQQIWMKYDGTSIEELTFANIPYGNLLVTKSDALTGKPLQGAKFRVTEGTGAVAGNTNGEYTTDSAGQFLVSNIKPGAYVVTELEAPHGYVSDTVPQTVTIGVDGKTYQVNFANQPIGGLLITKRDSISMLPLSGATFQVTDSHGAYIGDSGNGLYTTDATGTIIITDIEPGAYVITEVDAPNGYLKDDNSQTIHIEYGMVKYVDFYNTPLGGLLVKKYDSVTQEPLAEAVFLVTDILGAVVGTSDGLFRTDETGTFYIPSLPPGGYRVQEIQSPEGYILDNVAQTVHILDEKMYSLEFFNRPVNEFVIMKYDAITKEPLPNATVKVEKLGDTTTLIGEYITDADGRINVPDLEPGSYSVQEIQAPPGYALDNTAKIVNLVQNKGLVVTLFDYPLGGLLIRKYDSQSMQALPGAVFAINKQDGTFIGEFTTNPQGFVMLPLLEQGFYVIEELRPPDGYIMMDNNPQTVEVKTNDLAMATFFNAPMSSLIIKKFDAITKNPLMGARFEITKKSGDILGEYTTDAYGVIQLDELEPGWYSAVEVSPPDGYKLYEQAKDFEITDTGTVTLEFPNEKLTSLVIKKIDDKTGEPLTRAKFVVEHIDGEHVGEYTTDADGLINIPELAPDWYILREVIPPDGYLLDEEPKTVEVKTTVPTVVTFSNKKLAALEIIKIDEVSGEPLAGAKFAVEMQNGERVGEYTTDGTGLISIPALPPEWYVIRELKAPDGYLLDETPKTVEVKTSAPTVITFTNKPLTGLQIKKEDANTGVPLGGAKFAVEKQNGERVGEWITNNTGFISIPLLDPDWYVVREVIAPTGYILDETPKTVEVKTAAPTVVTFVDRPLS